MRVGDWQLTSLVGVQFRWVGRVTRLGAAVPPPRLVQWHAGAQEDVHLLSM